MTNRTLSETAFTRVEVMAVLTALGLLAIAVWPILAKSGKAAERAVCGNNLQGVGQAWQSWLAENSAPFPWQRSAAEGGLPSMIQVQNTYRTFQYLSNHLASPESLVCPADAETVMRATNWAAFEINYYRGNALSYTVGTDSYADMPNAMLSGDRHFVGTQRQGCTFVMWALALMRGDPAVGWNTNAIHGDSGNLLKVDGSVFPCDSAGLRDYLTDPETDPNGNHHTLPPR